MSNKLKSNFLDINSIKANICQISTEKLSSNTIFSDDIRTVDGTKYVKENQISNTHIVGEQWISFDGTIPVGGIPFLGQIVYREQYKELYDFIKKNNRHKTEEEWQTISNTNKGNVPYYAIDEIAGVNAYVNQWTFVSFDINAINVIKDGNTIETITFDEPFGYVDGCDTAALETLINEKSNLITLTVGDRATDDGSVYYPFTFTYNEDGIIGNDVIVQIVKSDSTIEEYVLSGGVDCVPSETIRMPKFNGYFKGADEAGQYIKQGLPNISGTFSKRRDNNANSIANISGAFTYSNTSATNSHYYGNENTSNGHIITFNASKSNSIYGSSSNVTPETNTVIVGVYAFGTITNTSNIDVEDIIHAYESNDKVIQSLNSKLDASLLPVGSIIPYGASKTPDGYLLCNGATVSRTTYSDLFAAIGTTWGSGDGSTTFTLPGLIDRVPWGSFTAGTYKTAGLPNISGSANFTTGATGARHGGLRGASGALTASNALENLNGGGATGTGIYGTLNLSAKNSNSIYGASTTVQPPAATVRFIIKYK